MAHSQGQLPVAFDWSKYACYSAASLVANDPSRSIAQVSSLSSPRFTASIGMPPSLMLQKSHDGAQPKPMHDSPVYPEPVAYVVGSEKDQAGQSAAGDNPNSQSNGPQNPTKSPGLEDEGPLSLDHLKMHPFMVTLPVDPRTNLFSPGSSSSTSNTKRRSKDSADKPFKCLVEGCPAAFHQVCNLRTHEIVKHGRQKKFERTTVKNGVFKPYRCMAEGCTSAFLHAGNLRTHEIQKHGRPKKFSRKARVESDDLLADIPFGSLPGLEGVSGVQKSYFPLSSVAKPFQCTVPGCGSSYSQAGNLRTHEVYKHGRPKKFTRNAKPDQPPKSSAETSSQPAVSTVPLTEGALSTSVVGRLPFDSKARTAAWIETLSQYQPPSQIGLHSFADVSEQPEAEHQTGKA